MISIGKLKIGALVLVGIIAIASIAGAFAVMYYVGVGHAAILVDIVNHTYAGPVLGPGWFTKSPFQDVKDVYIATEIVDMWTEYDANGTPLKSGDWPALDVPTQEGLILHMDVSVRWHLITAQLLKVVQNFPDVDSYKDKVVLPAIREVVRDTTGKNSALDLYGPKRDAISAEVRTALTTRLDIDPIIPQTIVLEDFYMRQVFLPADFAKAVEQKQVAQQQLEQASFQRQTTIINANATASAQIIAAQGQAEAVRIITDQFKNLTPNEIQAYVALKYIEALRDGFTQGNKVIILIPQGAGGFILNIPNVV